MSIRPEVLPFIFVVILVFGLCALILRARKWSARAVYEYTP